MGYRNSRKGYCLLLSILFFTAILLFANSAFSQNEWIRSLKDSTPQERIKHTKKDVELDKELSNRAIQMQHSVFTLDKSFVPQIKKDKGHIIIQLTRPLDNAMKETLVSFEVELLQYIPSNSWKARVSARNVAKVKALDFVYAMGNIHVVDKFPKHVLDRGLGPHSFNSDGTVSIMVTFHNGILFDRVKEILTELSGTTEQMEFITGNMVLLTISQDKVQSVSEYDEVNWIEDRPTPKKTNNINAAILSNVDDIQMEPYNLTGSGIKIGEWDEGPVQSDHPDLNGKVTVMDAGSVSSHATHVAGTILGSGLGNSSAKGMAQSASLYSYDYNGDVLAEKSSAVSTNGIQLSNNSWGYINGWQYNFYGDLKWVWFGDANFGAYVSQSQAWDQTVIDTNLIIVKSAGNDRADFGDSSQGGHHHYGDSSTVYTDYHPTDNDYDSIGEVGNAKNIITVGAVDDSGLIAYFSSWGPSDDGRVKPDLVANGSSLVSTYPTNTYASLSGTSMSSPVVTGATALVMHKYLSKFGTYPSPHMVKALLVNAATDLGNTGPDYSYGWGLMDAKAAVDMIIGGSDFLRAGSVSNSSTLEYSVTVPSSTPVFKVTAAWTDPAGTPGAAKALVNDIGIELVDPVGGIYNPWKLDPANPSANATKGVNSADNVEQVLVDAPQSGTWTIRVKGTSIQGSQSFAIVSNIALSARNEPDISVGTTSNDFGTVKVGSSSPSRTFTVSNTGLQPLTVSSVTLTGPNASEYIKQSDYCSGFTLPTSGACTVSVVFSPASEGQRNASLSIASDDPDTPTMNVPLSGKGDSTAPVTTPSIKGGTYFARQEVKLTANESATIYYTTDGSEPTISSTVYSSPILVHSSILLKYFAEDSAGNKENVKTEAYVINPPLWTSQIGTSGWDEAWGVATDGSGNVYVTGYTEGDLIPGLNNPGDQDFFLIKYDSNGNRLWTVQERSLDWYYENGTSVVVDISGNVYVAVESQSGLHGYTALGSYDGYLIKYDSSGNRLWTRQIATTAWEDINSVAVDSSGNAYVTGGTKGGLDGYTNAGNEDLFIIKFDADGNRLWTRQMGTTANDYGYEATIDAYGNAYIGGGTSGGLDGNTNAGGSDIFLVKYDSSGNKLWTKQMGTSTNEQANAVSVDGDGYVYLTGYTSGGLDGNINSGSGDVVLVKYDPNGNKLWTKQIGGTSWESGTSVKTDLVGNLYIAGITGSNLDGNSNAGSYDIFLMKFDNNGNKKWTKVIGSLDEDDAYDLALDANGYAYIAGSTWGNLDGNTTAGDYDFFVMKLDTAATVGTIYINGGVSATNSTSVTLNLSCYDGIGNCTEMVFSNNGVDYSAPEPYISSRSWTIESGDGTKIVYAKFKNNSGEWSNPYWDAISLDTVPPVTVASPAGGSFGSAQSVILSANETATIYYTSDGSLPTTSSAVYSSPVSISSTTVLMFFAVDSAGNPEDVKTEIFFIDIDASWTKQTGTSTIDKAKGVARDSGGNIYVAGDTSGSLHGNTSAGSSDIFLVKYDKNGNRVWTKQFGSSANDTVEAIAVDANGNAYLTGSTYGSLDGNTYSGSADFFIVKYDRNGNRLWTREMGTASVDSAYSVAVDSNGNAYVVGRTYGGLDGNTSAGYYDIFMVKFDAGGNKLWTRQTGTGPTKHDYGYGVSLDPSGNPYVTGSSQGNLDGNVNAGSDDIVLIKYDQDGNKVWTREFGSVSSDISYAVAVDTSGNAYIVGDTLGGLDGNTNAGSLDIFIIKYDANGNRQWTRQIGTTAADHPQGVSMDSAGNAYLTGYTSGGLDGNINKGNKDIFVIKYDSNGNKIWTKQFGTTAEDSGDDIIVDRGWNAYLAGYTYGGLNGNTSSGSADLFLMRLASDDITAPTGSISINSGNTHTNSTSVTLTLSCIDGSGTGCSEATFSNDNINWSAPETFASNKSWTLGSGEGTKTVYVRYIDYAGNISESYSSSIVLDTTPPSAPSNISVDNPGVKGQLLVTWTNPINSDFNHIHIYRSTASGTLGTLIADNVTGIKYTDTGLASLTTYYYTVRAVDNIGNESTNATKYSAKTSDATPPAVPANVTATDAGIGGRINLSWTNPADSDLAMIKVYRSTASGTLGSAVFMGLATSYSDTGLTNGTTYYYTVRAVDTSNNETTNTTQPSATPTAPDTTPAGIPGSVTATDTQAGGTLGIIWTNPTDLDFAYIRIYRSTTSGQLGTLVMDNVTGTSATNSGLTNNATYYYTVRSVDTAGNESTNVNQASGMPTDIDDPKPVLGLMATMLSSGQVRLDWTKSPSSDINAYHIYWDNGSGTLDYAYSNKIGTVSDPTTTWTSGGLTVGTRYLFAVRAEDTAQNEEANTTSVVSMVPVSNSADGSERTYVSTPKTGRKIGGSRVTVVADLLTGTASDVVSVSFEYKPAAGGSWTAITPSDASFSNPDTTRPWFVHWDVTGFANGDYLLRAVANNGSADPDPEYVTVTVDNATQDLNESPDSGRPNKSEKVSVNVSNSVVIGDLSGLTTLTITSTALSSDTKVNITIPDPAIWNPFVPSDYGKANEFREITLDSGQTSLSNSKEAEIVIPYKDDNNDNIIDGTTTKVYDTKVMRYNTTTSKWEKLDSVVDTTTKTVQGKTNHFTLIGLLAPPNPTVPGWNIVAVPLQPNPNSASSVFGQTPYVYNPTTQTYTRPSTVSPGIGYWIKGGANLTANGTETPSTGNFSISIKKGWNMIGNPFRFKVKVSDMKVNYNSTEYTMSQAETDGIVIGTLYPYVNGVYQFVNASDGGAVEPWVGYWILSDKDMTLLVPPTPAQ